MVILLMVIGVCFINSYSINGYWWIFYCGYWCLLMAIILVAIGDYFIGGYWWILIGIILVAIDGYYINDY